MEFLIEADVELPFQFFPQEKYPINLHGSFLDKTPVTPMIARDDEWIIKKNY